FKPVFAARSTVFSESRLKDARPETRRPEDFDDFWDTTLDEVARGRGDFKEVLDNSRSDSRMQLYRFSFKSLGGRRVRGWLCVPASGAVGPAILLLPGYSDGSKFIPLQLIERGCAVMALDPRGHGESVREGSRRFPGFISENVLDRLRYPYRGVYMDCLVAVRHLLSHPRVDGGRVGVMGMSQGGGLALITASFERNVAFAIADSPFLADMVRGIRLATDGPYVELAEYLDKRPSTREKVLENLSYFDAVNFAERVACPTLMCVGLMDTICPPITAYATYNTLRCIKRIDTYPRMGHFCGVYGHQDRKIEWIKKCLRLCDG
ncbi:MAG: alpha/beta fold hydrolase, partial [Candidatus Bathyarchaeia archaeon]